jgi:hypothetical protein
MDRNDINSLAKLLIENVGKPEISEKKVPAGEIGEAELIKGGPPAKMEKVEEVKNPGDKGAKKADKKKDLKKENTEMLPKSTFEELYKSTINEADEMMGDELDVGADAAPEAGGELGPEGSEQDTTEEVDIATRLEMIMDDLKSVIAEIRGEPEGEEGMGEEGGEGWEGGEGGMGAEGGEGLPPVGEAVVSEPEPKDLPEAGGKKLMGKGQIKPSSSVKPVAAAQNHGEICDEPEPKDLGDKGKTLMGKGNMKVSASKIKQGKSAFE